MSNTFKQLIKILNEAGVSPAREGQVETEEGVIYDDAASITRLIEVEAWRSSAC